MNKEQWITIILDDTVPENKGAGGSLLYCSCALVFVGYQCSAITIKPW